MSTATNTRKANHTWLWALLPLLLAAALAIPLLDVDAFTGDEPVSLVAAGILNSGPRSLANVWDFMAENDPRNAPGWPILLSVWGPFVGWSEFAIRALSLYIGLLTLAWVFRSGRGLFAPLAGFYAALLLGSSVFLLAYMIHARAFTLVALCATICLVELLARRPAPATTRQGRAGWPSAWECWTALVALLWCSAPARAGSVSPALRPEEPSLVAACCPLRIRRPVSRFTDSASHQRAGDHCQ